MIHIKRILLVIFSPIFVLTIIVDFFAFIAYYVTTGKCYIDDYQPFGLALFGWANCGFKKKSFKWKFKDLFGH